MTKQFSAFRHWLSSLNRADLKRGSDGAQRPKYVNLTPIDSADKDGAYTHAILAALNDPSVLNVAITGPYGSGKSSVIKTFNKQYKNIYPTLHISLATFEDSKNRNGEKEQSEIQDQEIERSILQQMLYGNDSKKLKYSRFKRIVTPKWSLAVSVLFVFAVLSGLWVLNHFDDITYDTFLTPNPFWIPFTYLFIYVVIIGEFIYRQTYKLNVSKVSLKNGEIQLGEKPDSSILNRHLDEILYFFECTKYNVVVFEDLDRFDSPNIFIKLREINTLINRGKKPKKRVRFIYAVKDGLFGSQTRTKFFDFIIPIVPVIDCNNAGEKMKERLADTNFNEVIPSKFLREVSVYLTDLRLIHNIFNEFNIYCEKVANDTVDATKLLSVLIYKNVFPSDFEKLHFQTGVLYDLCKQHRDIRNAAIAEIDAQIADIRQSIQDSEKEEAGSVEELRFLFSIALSQYVHDKFRNWDVSSIHTGSKNYSHTDLMKESVLEDLSSVTISTVTITNQGRQQNQQINKSIDEICANKFDSKPFAKRLQAVTNKAHSRRLDLQREIQKLEGKKVEIRNGSFALSISSNMDSLEPASDAFKKDFKLFQYLVLNGHLDESYGMYTSLFYEGSLTQGDMDFLRQIYAHIVPQLDYHLTYVGEVIARMSDEDFSSPSVLNLSLINHLLSTKSSIEKKRLKYFLDYTRHSYKDASDFIHTYLTGGKHKAAFINKFTSNWPLCIEDIIKGNLSSVEYIRLLVLRILQHVSPSFIENKMNEEHEFSSFVAEHLSKIVTASPEGLEDFESLIQLNPSILDLPSVSEHKALVDACIEHSLYRFTTDNMILIAQIISKSEKGTVEDSQTKILSVIRASENSTVIDHIDFFLSDYLTDVALNLPKNTNEELDTLIYVANHEEVSHEDKIAFIDQQALQIPLTDAFPESLWQHFIESDRLTHSWENVSLCLGSEHVSQESLAAYLSQDVVIDNLLAAGNPKELLDEDACEQLEEFIVSHAGPKGDAYQRLLTVVDGQFDSVTGADIPRLEALLKSNILSFSKQNISAVSGNPKLYAKLITNNFEDFEITPNVPALDAAVFIELFKSELKDAQVYVLLDKLPESMPTESEPVTKAMASSIASMKDLSSVSDAHLLLSIQNLNTISSKLALFSRVLDRFDEATVMRLWRGFPEPYCDVGTYGKRPKIPKSQSTESLLYRMQDAGMLIRVTDDKDELKVSTFKSADHD